MGRKYTDSDEKGGYTDRDVLIKYFSEREKDRKDPESNNDTLHIENGSNSVPTSHDTEPNSYESLIQEECFQSTGQPYYRCKIHPNIWDTD